MRLPRFSFGAAVVQDEPVLTDKDLLAINARVSNQLWVGTGIATVAVVAVILLIGFLAQEKTFIPEGLIGTIAGLWYTALGARSKFGKDTFKDFRESDHELGRIRAGANVPQQQTNVGAGGVAVNPPPPNTTQVNADAGGGTPGPGAL